MVSTDTTRKIETLRKWSKNPLIADASYLADIANEFERIYQLMTESRKALQFYADEKRYQGPNQRFEESDEYQPEDLGYLLDVTRDHGAIARKALKGK